MRQLLAILGVLILLLITPITGAQESLLLSESNSYVLISENSASEKIILKYVIPQNSENTLQDNLRVRGTLSNVNVYDSEGGLSFSVENIENEWSLISFTLRESLSGGDRSNVTAEFTIAVENTGGNRVCRIGYEWSILPTSYQIVAKLPKESSLKSTSEDPSETYTENESLWMRYSGVMTDSFQTHVVFAMPSPEEEPSTEGEQPSEEKQGGEGSTLPLYVVLSVIAVITLLIIWTIRRRVIRPPKEVERGPEAVPRPSAENILGMLHKNERKVVEALIQEDNLTQTELCGKTGTPKATMSRILQGLEQKEVVRRVEHGMSKRVILAEWIKEWKGEKDVT